MRNSLSVFHGDLVQLVEHLVRNQKVAGSTPAFSTNINIVLPCGAIGNTPDSESGISSSSLGGATQ